MTFTVPLLPYDPKDFENVISDKAFAHHYEYHKLCVESLNNLVDGT